MMMMMMMMMMMVSAAGRSMLEHPRMQGEKQKGARALFKTLRATRPIWAMGL
jgi:hypothetical protein